jgi:N-acetylmuramoyl-L-alanine amidase
VVVVDPGHGGSDTGALGPGGATEKELALALAKRIAAALGQAGMRVTLTREGDTFIPLTQRTALANYNRADVLLSIHLNASPASSATGAETYFMSKEATDLWSRQLAEKENSAGDPTAGSDTLSLVLWNLAQTQSIVGSAALAEAIQGRLNGLLGTKERGVRQAPFAVLEGARMPAVLVEVAFLTNPGEAQQLQDVAFQDQVAASLAASVADFRARSDAPPNPAPPAP